MAQSGHSASSVPLVFPTNTPYIRTNPAIVRKEEFMKQADIEVMIKFTRTSLSADEMESCLRWKATHKVDKPESMVVYECKYGNNLEEDWLEDHIKNACTELESRSAEIRNLPVDCEHVIWCVIHSKNHFVGSYLDTVLINRLAHLNTDVALSYYEPDYESD